MPFKRAWDDPSIYYYCYYYYYYYYVPSEISLEDPTL